MSFRICSAQRAENPIVQRRNNLRIWNAGPADFDSITINIDRLVRATDDHGDWTAARFVGVPVKFARSDWLTLLPALREEQTRMHRFGWSGVLVGDDHRRTFHRDAEEQLGKFQREPDAAV